VPPPTFTTGRVGTRRPAAIFGFLVEIKIDQIRSKKRGIFLKSSLISHSYFCAGHLFNGWKQMTDQQLALEAINEAQLILEDYLRPRPQNNERILDRLVEVLERPDLIVAVSRLQLRSSLSVRS
jgi:hypothetical protein